MILDSQVHIWAAEAPDRKWVRDDPHRAEPLGYEELRDKMDEAGVDAAILVPPSWEGDRNDYSLEAARKYPQRFAVMGRLSIERPQTRAELETWCDQPGMLGVRLTFNRDYHAKYLTDGTADWFWPAAERLNIPVMLLIPHSVAEIGAIAARHPRLRLIIDHMGMGRAFRDDGLAKGIDRLIPLAVYPNVSVKISGITNFSSEPFPFRNVQRFVQRVVEAFGPRRCYWGTDLSRMLSICTYREAVTAYSEEMPFLSPDDKEWIMGRSLSELLGWPNLAQSAA